MREPILNALISLLAMVRTTVEAAEAEDGAADPDLAALLVSQRGILAREWLTVHMLTPDELGMALATFKETMIQMMLTGLTEQAMGILTNRAPVGDVCDIGERYFYSFCGEFDVFRAQAYAPATLLALATQDVRIEIADPVNFESRTRFDDRVFRKVIALIYAIEAAGGRLDRPDDGGEASDACVPRAPVGPARSAEATAELPPPRPEIAEAVAGPARR
ncbi:MAG TPA: hypothetical protein VKT77_18450 [Chthonomonadaceae bacterium]|nr:hypothetical protein [Chthonomonadaceae bacterium]